METDRSTHIKNISTLIHASTFSKYFFPFGNFIFPLALWLSNKNKAFVNAHGRQCLNFQISTFLYAAVLAFMGFLGVVFFFATANQDFSFDPFTMRSLPNAIPFFIFIGIIGVLFFGLFVLEICCVIQASVKASEGRPYKYPISIPFIPANSSEKEWFTTLKTEAL